MAYVLGNKVVKDTESQFDNYAYGIVGSGESPFGQTFTSFEAAKANLRNLLLTKQGERVMQPEFGTGLHSLLFEPMDNQFEDRLIDTITESVNFWLPYIDIEEIEVEMTDAMKDQNRANLNVTFRVANQIETDSVLISVQG